MPEESPVGASVANVVIESGVWEMQTTTSTIVAYAEWPQNTTLEPRSMNAGSRKTSENRWFRSANW